jgi:cystathionine gamma-synthase
MGSTLSPFDSWLILRGIKTLAVRMERAQENALAIANWLKQQPKVKQVYYVGLPEHPGYAVNKKQARGSGAMLSFALDSAETALQVLAKVKIITFAESLGGPESLITLPATQTHADVPAEERERLGITDSFLRMSVGLENASDLIEDLKQAMA